MAARFAIIALGLFGCMLNSVVEGQPGSQNNCMQMAQTCVMPLVYQYGGMNMEAIAQHIQQEGLAQVCSAFVTMKSCLMAVLPQCAADIPVNARQALQMVADYIDFVCVDEFQLINENRECLIDSQLEQQMQRQCMNNYQNFQPTSVCQLDEPMDCIIQMITTACGNDVGNAYRNWWTAEKQKLGCNQEISLRHLFRTMLRR